MLKGKKWKILENSRELQVPWSTDRKHEQRFCSKKGFSMDRWSQDEEDVELKFVKGYEDPSVSNYSRISVVIWSGNMDPELHQNVKDGIECVLEKPHNKERAIW